MSVGLVGVELRRQARTATVIFVAAMLSALAVTLAVLASRDRPGASTASKVNRVCSGHGGALQLASDTVICRDGLAFTLH